eukprot:gene5126-17040_t
MSDNSSDEQLVYGKAQQQCDACRGTYPDGVTSYPDSSSDEQLVYGKAQQQCDALQGTYPDDVTLVRTPPP